MRLLPFFVCLLFVLAGGMRMRTEVRRGVQVEALGTELDGAAGQVSGTVKALKEEEERLVLTLERCEGNWGKEKVRLRGVQVYWEKEEASRAQSGMGGIQIGNTVWFSGTWSRFERARNPGGFDGWLYSRAMKLDARMYAEVGEVTDSRYSWYREGLRQISVRAGGTLGQITRGTDKGIYQAAVLGDKTELNQAVQAMYQRNGIAHLLAISGLHMSLIGMAAYQIFRRLGAGYGWAGLAGAVFVVSYGIMAGGSASVVRASVMLLGGFGAAYLGRTYDLLSALGLAGILLLWDSPYLVTQAGVQLSFGAVIGIGGMTKIFDRFFISSGRLDFMVRVLSASLCVQLATAPIILYHYFQFPLYGVFLNLLVVPLMAYVVASGIAGILLGAFSLRAGMFAVGTGHYILALYEALCRLCERLPWSNLVLGRPGAWQIGVYYLILALVWTGMGRRWFCRRSVAAAGMALAAVCLLPLPVQGLEVTFLDVGQGDGICLQSGGYTVLVDGGSSDEKKLGEYCLEPFLKSEAVTEIDYAWVSHGDQDHISGLVYLLEQSRDVQIRNLLLPALGRGDEAYEPLCWLVEARGGSVFWVGRGDVLELGKLRLTCLYPGDGDTAADRNEQSTVLKADYGDFHLLLTGDMSEDREKALLEDGTMSRLLSDTQVLKLAHHGSRFSNSVEWLEVVDPVWAVVSYGRDNRYGHPHEEVRERLGAQAIRLWETAECGAVEIWTDGEKVRWKTYLPR